MFESIVTKCIHPQQAKLTHNDTLYITTEEDESDDYFLYKGAETYLYTQLDIKPSTSKEVHKKSLNIWQELMDLQLLKIEETGKFSLTKPTLVYLVDSYNHIVDMYNFNTEEAVKEFEQKHKQLIVELTTIHKTKKFYTDSKDETVKLICYNKEYDVTQKDYTPIVILELNTKKAIYSVYSGILIYNTFHIIPNLTPIIEKTNSLINLIHLFNMDEWLDFSEQQSESLYNSYKDFQTVEISARELTRLVKSAGYKLKFNWETAELYPIDAINNTEDSEKIADFYNTFNNGESAMDILELNEFEKTFKYNKLTLNEVLTIFSKEFLQYSGSKITIRTLIDIVVRLSSRTTDKNQADKVMGTVTTN